jgi:hypothetical protein
LLEHQLQPARNALHVVHVHRQPVQQTHAQLTHAVLVQQTPALQTHVPLTHALPTHVPLTHAPLTHALQTHGPLTHVPLTHALQTHVQPATKSCSARTQLFSLCHEAGNRLSA